MAVAVITGTVEDDIVTSTSADEKYIMGTGSNTINFDISNNNVVGNDTIELTTGEDLILDFGANTYNQIQWERVNNTDGTADIVINTLGYCTWGYAKMVQLGTDNFAYTDSDGNARYWQKIQYYLYDYENNDWVLKSESINDYLTTPDQNMNYSTYGRCRVDTKGNIYDGIIYNDYSTDRHEDYASSNGILTSNLDYSNFVNTITIKDVGREDSANSIKLQWRYKSGDYVNEPSTLVENFMSETYAIGLSPYQATTTENQVLQGTFLNETFRAGYGDDTINTVGGTNTVNLYNGGKDVITLGVGADTVDGTFAQEQAQGHYEDLGTDTVANGGVTIINGDSQDTLKLSYEEYNYFYKNDNDLVIIQNYQYSGSTRLSKFTVEDYFANEDRININGGYYGNNYQVSNGEAIFYKDYIYTNKNGYFLDKEGNVYIRTFGYNDTERHYENTYTPVMQNSDSKYNQLGLTKEECVSIINSNDPDENGYYTWVKNDTTYYFKYNSETEEYNIYTKDGGTYTQYTEQKNVNYAIDTVFTTNVAFVKNADGYINTIYNDYYLDENGNVYTRTSQYDYDLGKTVYIYQPLMQDSTIFYNQIGLTFSMYNDLPEEDGYRKYETEDGTYYVNYNYGYYNIYTKENDTYNQLTEQKNINYPMYVSINTWHEGGYYHWWYEDMELTPALSTVGSYVEGEGNVNGTDVNEALVANNQAEITTGEGDDKIYTSSASDTITIDGSGNKEIFISNNSGNDVIDIQNNEALTYLIGGYKEMHKSGDDLVLHRTINSQGDIATTSIKDYFTDEFAPKRANIYSSGSSTSVLKIDNLYIDADLDNEHSFTGTPYLDIINGTDEADTISVGTDTINYNYTDTITPGAGDDVINITGSTTKNIYFAKNDGNDIININSNEWLKLYLNYTDRNEGNSHIIDDNGNLILYRTYVDNGGDDIHTDSIKITGIQSKTDTPVEINEENIANYSETGLNISGQIQFNGKHWTQMSDSHSSTADYTENFAANNPIYRQGETDSENTIEASLRSNLVTGGSQNDTISATGEINHVYSAAGDDSITVDSSVSSVIYAGSGDDIITVRGHKLNEEDTSITSIANIYTQAGNDTVNVESGMANIYLAGGNDVVNITGGTGGTINFTAGGGNKTINFIGASDARYDFNFYGYEDMDRANTYNMEYDYYHFTKNGNNLIIDAKYHEYINGNTEYHFETHTINNYFSASDAKIDPVVLYRSYYLRDSLYNYDGSNYINSMPLNTDSYYDEERNATIFDGTPFSDMINGTDGVDIISTGEGSDETITGGKGDDIINLDGKNYRHVIVKKGDGNDVIDISKAFTDGNGSLYIGDYRGDEKFESSYRIDGNDLILYRTYNEGDNFHTDSVRITGIDNSYRKVTKYPLGLTQEACKTIAESQQPNKNGYYEWGTDNTTYCFKYDNYEYSYYIKNEDGTYTTIASYSDCPQKFRDAIYTIRQIQQPDENGYYSWKDDNTYYFKYDTYDKQYYMYTRNEYAYTYVNYDERPSYLSSSIRYSLQNYQLPDNDGYYKWEDNDTYYLKYNATSGEYDVFTKNDDGEYVLSTDYPSYFTNNVRSTIVDYTSSNDDGYYVFGEGTGKTYYFKYDYSDFYTRSEIEITAENIANYDGGLNASGNIYIYDQYNQNYNTFSSHAFDASMKQYYQGDTNTANTMSTEENSNNLILGGDKNDTITANGNMDYIYAGSGDDVITSNANNSNIYDGAGNDTITVTSGTNNIYLGAGSDTVRISGGQGTIYLTQGSGNNTITFKSNNDDGTCHLDGVYNINFSGAYGDYIKSGDDLIIRRNYSTDDTITVKGLFGENQLSDGNNLRINGSTISSMTVAGNYDKKQKATIFSGSNYGDTINGTKGKDIITTGAGNDYIYTRKGNDTVIIDGSGSKTIYYEKGGNNTIQLVDGVSLGNINLYSNDSAPYTSSYKIVNNDFVWYRTYIDGDKFTTETTKITGIKPLDSENPAEVTYDNISNSSGGLNISGKLISKPYLEAKIGNFKKANKLSTTEGTSNMVIGGKKNDTITLNGLEDKTYTGAGADKITVNGAYGSDQVFAGSGNDKITLNALDKSVDIYGGKGNDKIYANGSGRYNFYGEKGDGNDTIILGKDFNKAIYFYNSGTSPTQSSYKIDKNNNLILYRTYVDGDNIITNSTTIKGIKSRNAENPAEINFNNIAYSSGGLNISGSYISNFNKNMVQGKAGKANKLSTTEGTTNVVIGGKKKDKVTLNGYDYAYTGKGNDTITVNSQNSVYTYAGSGNDTINVKNGYNNIYSGKGKDKINISGGSGYIYLKAGEGNDTITFSGEDFGTYRISFEGYNSYNNYYKNGNDLLIKCTYRDAKGKTKSETHTIKDYFANEAVLKDKLSLGYDGTVSNCLSNRGLNIIGKYDKKKKATIFEGTEYRDTVVGTKKKDIIYTGDGSDKITAGKGNDEIIINSSQIDLKYVYLNNGDGNDIIKWADGAESIVDLVINQNDVLSYEKSDRNLIITRSYQSGNSIKSEKTTIENFYDEDGNPVTYNISDHEYSKVFINDLPINTETSFNRVNYTTSTFDVENNYEFATGTKKADTVNITADNSSVFTLAGNDTINVNSADSGITYVAGGSGADTINLNTTGKVYVQHQSGDGNDTINFGENIPSRLTLSFESPVFDNKDGKLSHRLNALALSGKFGVKKSGDDLIVSIPTTSKTSTKTETVTLTDYFNTDVTKPAIDVAFTGSSTIGNWDLSFMFQNYGIWTEGTVTNGVTTYTGLDGYKNHYEYKGTGKTIINGSDEQDYYLVNINSKSNLYINDAGCSGYSGDGDTMCINTSYKNLRALFNMSASGQVIVSSDDTYSDNFMLFNKGSLTYDNIKNIFSGKDGKGVINIDNFFGETTNYSPNGVGAIESIYAQKNIVNKIVDGGLSTYNYDIQPLHPSLWVEDLGRDVANWLAANTDGSRTAFEIFENGTKAEITSLLKVYNTAYDTSFST